MVISCRLVGMARSGRKRPTTNTQQQTLRRNTDPAIANAPDTRRPTFGDPYPTDPVAKPLTVREARGVILASLGRAPSLAALYREIHCAGISAVAIGGRWFIRRVELLRWIRSARGGFRG